MLTISSNSCKKLTNLTAVWLYWDMVVVLSLLALRLYKVFPYKTCLNNAHKAKKCYTFSNEYYCVIYLSISNFFPFLFYFNIIPNVMTFTPWVISGDFTLSVSYQIKYTYIGYLTVVYIFFTFYYFFHSSRRRKIIKNNILIPHGVDKTR